MKKETFYIVIFLSLTSLSILLVAFLKLLCLEILCRFLCDMDCFISLQFVFWLKVWVAFQNLFLCSQI